MLILLIISASIISMLYTFADTGIAIDISSVIIAATKIPFLKFILLAFLSDTAGEALEYGKPFDGLYGSGFLS